MPIKDIAILIPAYNAEATLGETLESIQNLEGGLERVEAVYIGTL
jgi:glycosyltransferase involved in cell wall biosynthesis